MDQDSINTLSSQIIGCAIEVHRVLGPGLYENAYEKCLVYELKNRGFNVKSQEYVSLNYKGMRIDKAYRLDLLIDDALIVEIKSVENLEDIHSIQLMTYMKLMKVNVGLLLNFNHSKLKFGIKRLNYIS